MKHRLAAVLIGGIAAIAFGQIASAADLPRKAPAYMPPPAPIFTWTGFYVGAQAGWSRIHDTADMSSPTFAISVSDSANGFVGGGYAGYNWQANPNWVFGIEGDIEGNSTEHTFFVGPPFDSTTTATEKLQWQGS